MKDFFGSDFLDFDSPLFSNPATKAPKVKSNRIYIFEVSENGSYLMTKQSRSLAKTQFEWEQARAMGYQVTPIRQIIT